MGNFLAIFAIVLGGLVNFRIFCAPKNLVESWASRSGWQLLSSERRWHRLGPYYGTTRIWQRVYYVTLRDRDGRVQKCWVRFGGFFLGQVSNNVDTHWER